MLGLSGGGLRWVPAAACWFAIAACDRPQSHVHDAGSAVKDVSAPALKRPPFPNMASAAFGQDELAKRLAALPPALAGALAPTLDQVLDAIHEVSLDSERNAGDLALGALRAASSKQARGTLTALFAATLVLDPHVEGYKDRVTDAFGIAAYAGSLDATDSLGQAARALVSSAAGARAQALALAKVVVSIKDVNPQTRLFLALTHKAAGDTDIDSVVDELTLALQQRPSSPRVRAALAEAYLDLGMVNEAIVTATAPQLKSSVPWLNAIAGRAQVIAGQTAAGIGKLREAERTVDESRRGDVMYWLGRSLTQGDTWATEVPPLAAALTTRAGYVKEARTLEALVQLLNGDTAGAGKTLEGLTQGPAQLAVDVDVTWLTLDVCAALGDAGCVERLGARAVRLDGDVARLARARVLVVKRARPAPVDGGTVVVNAVTLEREAHRLSPFDAQLGAAVGEPTQTGGAAAATAVRAARKALLRGGPKLARTLLEPRASTCRICAAVLSAAFVNREAMPWALKSLAMATQTPLADADLITVIHALGAAPTAEAVAALDTLSKASSSADVTRAIANARADHRDPDARRRRDVGADVDQGAVAPDRPQDGAPTPTGAP